MTTREDVLQEAIDCIKDYRAQLAACQRKSVQRRAALLKLGQSGFPVLNDEGYCQFCGADTARQGHAKDCKFTEALEDE